MGDSKYVLYFHCPLYKDSSAGVVTIHKIIDYFNINKQPAYILLQNESIGAEGYKMPGYNNGLITPLLTEDVLNSHIQKGLIPIVFYPDTISDNPFKFKNICRMMFYYDSIYTGKTSLNSSQKEGIMFFSKAIQERASVNKSLYQDIISFPVGNQDLIEYKNITAHERREIYYYDGKFTNNFSGIIPKEIRGYKKIDRGEKKSLNQSDLFEVLKGAKLLHVFEDTALIYEALLLGCPVNIHPDGCFYKNHPLAHHEVNFYGSMSKRCPSEDDIRVAQKEIIKFKKEYKDWCKYGENGIKKFKENFQYHKYEFDNENIEKIKKNISQSFKYLEEYADQKVNKKFLNSIKNKLINFGISIFYKIYKVIINTSVGKKYIKKYLTILYFKLPIFFKRLITNNIAKIKS